MAGRSNLAAVSLLILFCFVVGENTRNVLKTNTETEWTLPSRNEAIDLMKRGPRFTWMENTKLRKLVGRDMVFVNDGRLMKEPAYTWKKKYGQIRLLKKNDGEVKARPDGGKWPRSEGI